MDLRIEKIAIEIDKIKNAVDHLEALGGELPALERNLRRIAASVKMLELNFDDPRKIVV